MILHRQELTQVVALHEKMMGQGEQVSIQSARREAQSQAGGGQGVGQVVVTPSQVTCPGSLPQKPSTVEQLEAPLQLTVPPFQQFALALQTDFCPMAGRLAAVTGAGAPPGMASEERNA